MSRTVLDIDTKFAGELLAYDKAIDSLQKEYESLSKQVNLDPQSDEALKRNTKLEVLDRGMQLLTKDKERMKKNLEQILVNRDKLENIRKKIKTKHGV